MLDGTNSQQKTAFQNACVGGGNLYMSQWHTIWLTPIPASTNQAVWESSVSTRQHTGYNALDMTPLASATTVGQYSMAATTKDYK